MIPALAVAITLIQGGMVFGGLDSCATWLSTSANENAGRHWILGFWSGKNMEAALAGGRMGRVGESTDGAGIVGEVKLACQAAPSKTLIAVTLETYERFKAENR